MKKNNWKTRFFDLFMRIFGLSLFIILPVFYAKYPNFCNSLFKNKDTILSIYFIFMFIILYFVISRIRRVKDASFEYDKLIFKNKFEIYSPLLQIVGFSVIMFLTGLYAFIYLDFVHKFVLENKLTTILLSVNFFMAPMIFVTYLLMQNLRKFYIGFNSSGIFIRDEDFIYWEDVKSVVPDWPNKIVIEYILFDKGSEKDKTVEILAKYSNISLDELLEMIKKYPVKNLSNKNH